MQRPSNVQNLSIGRFFLFAIAALVTGCGSSSSSTNTGSSIASTSTLAISPASVTLAEGDTYNFTASGGSGSGYTFSVSNGSYAEITATGYFYAINGWTGTLSVLVTDSAGNVASSTVNIVSPSSLTTSTSGSTYSVTGTLTNCEGLTGGSLYTNNWQVNGTELRTINDENNSEESPVYCSGLSVAGQIPTSATIQGVNVGIFLINQSTSADGSLLQNLDLVYANSIIGTLNNLNLLIPGNSGTFPTFTEGGSTNTWGAALTPAIVNASSFGVYIQAYRTTNRLFVGNSSAIFPQVTIYYSL